jgi:predicted transcriptional regulator of viral defense system
MALPRLYETFYARQVFTVEEARQKLKLSGPTLSRMLFDLQRQDYVVMIKKGLYAIKPVEAKGKDFSPDKYLVAAKLQKAPYLSYHTALELQGVAQSVFNTVYLSVPRQSKTFQYHGITYQFVTTFHSFGVEEKKVKNVSIKVTDREKTVIDGLEKLKYVGGLEEYIKSVSSLPSVDAVKVLRYLRLLNKKILYAKVGWLLSRFTKQWSIDEDVLNNLRKQLSKRTFYLEETNGKTNYRFDGKWNLMIPSNLESKLEENPQ